MAACVSDTIYASDLHDLSSAHTSRILPRSKMADVPDLFDIVWADKDGLQKMKTYIDAGGDPNLIEGTGQKRSLLEMFSYAGHETFVDTLLTKGASVSYVDANGHNAFYQASVADKSSILTRLITHVRTHGTNQELAVLINTRDARGITALHIASAKGYENVTGLLLQHGAQVDLSDDQGRTALHLSCYMGHEGIFRQLLQGFNAAVSITTSEGLTAKDFFKLGELKEDLRRSRIIENMLIEAERHVGILHEENKAGQREKFRRDENLNEFMTTFQRKCGSVFLAYRALESDAIQGATDTFTISNAINLLGSQVSLPGAGLVTTILSSGAAYIEDQIEAGKKEALTHFFTTIRDMENAVEQAAYDLTYQYESKIIQLTREGARTLAVCAVGRFIEFMRGSTEINNQVALSTLVLKSIQHVKPRNMMDRLPDLLPWATLIIETKDRSKRWTEGSVFEEVDHQLPNTLDSERVTRPVGERTSAETIPPVDSKIPTTNNSTQQVQGSTRGCCSIS